MDSKRSSPTASARRPSLSLDDMGWFDEGQGDPVLLLHSSGTSKRQWSRLCEPWAGRYRLLALDLWGYGETPFPNMSAPFRLSDEVALAEALLARVTGSVHVVGHSYGGAVALKLALDAPDRVRSIAVHEPVLFHLLRDQDQRAEWQEISEIADRVLALVRVGDSAGAAQAFVDYWNGEGAWGSLSPDQQVRAAKLAGKAPLDFSALFEERSSLSDYGRLAGRALVTVGEVTRPPTSKVAELLGQALGPGSLQTVPGAGHMAPVTHPELFRPLVEARLGADSLTA